jgi:hypothetical protein
LMHGFVEFADRSRRLVVAHSGDGSDRIVNKAAIATEQLTIPVVRYEICSSRLPLLTMSAITAIRFAAATIPTRGVRSSQAKAPNVNWDAQGSYMAPRIPICIGKHRGNVGA